MGLIPDNVIVASGSGANSEAVADMALALALSALKFIPFYQNEMKMDLWKRRVSKDLDALTAVILGTGSIGKAIAKKTKSFWHARCWSFKKWQSGCQKLIPSPDGDWGI